MILFLNFLLSIGILLPICFIAILLKQKSAPLPKLLLSSVFVLLLNIVIHTYAEANDLNVLYNCTFILADTIGFLLGPIILFYIKSIITERQKLSINEIFHFSFSVIYILFVSIPLLISRINGHFLYNYLQFIDDHQYILQLQPLFLCWYLVKSVFLLKRIKSISKQGLSNLSGKDLDWIMNLIYGILGVIGTNFMLEIYFYVTNGYLSIDNSLSTIALIVVISYLGYFGISQSQILLPEFIQNKIHKDPVSIHNKKESNHHLANASKEEIKKLTIRLNEVLVSEKPYLDENLSLKTLASMIPTTDRKLSALLNHYLNTNFYDLINSYRVKEVKDRLSQNESYRFTILALALDAGFSSKSSFNRIFKSETGLSPTEYKKQLNIKNTQ